MKRLRAIYDSQNNNPKRRTIMYTCTPSNPFPCSHEVLKPPVSVVDVIPQNINDTKCFKCKIEASIKCEDCHRLFCYHCDMKKHFLNPFHDRFSWASGYYEALPPTVTVDLNGTFTDWQPVVPVPVPKISCNCKDCNLNIKSSDIMCTFIMLSGRYDLYLPIFECQECGYSLPADAKMLYDGGYFCSSARKSNTFFSTKLLNNWHFLKRNSPGLSMKSLLIALQALGSHNGRDGCINFEAAKRTFQEWRFMQYELANVQSYNKNVCPACHTNPFAIHIDGNKKLFRYEKVGRGLRESYYSESVFAADNDVANHLNHIESLKTKVLYGGRWQHGSGLTTGEETEQIFSYMSRYNSTTKNMLKAEREEELSESSFFWNQRKHDSLARVLASRFCKAKEAAELIRKELADLSLDEKQLLIWIAELTNLAQSLNKRSVSQNDVQKGIELVCDSIRTKKSQISGVAGMLKLMYKLGTDKTNRNLLVFVKYFKKTMTFFLSKHI
nr:uncharacterized protein LOC123770371 [Procambarus clarkii]